MVFSLSLFLSALLLAHTAEAQEIRPTENSCDANTPCIKGFRCELGQCNPIHQCGKTMTCDAGSECLDNPYDTCEPAPTAPCPGYCKKVEVVCTGNADCPDASYYCDAAGKCQRRPDYCTFPEPKCPYGTRCRAQNCDPLTATADAPCEGRCRYKTCGGEEQLVCQQGFYCDFEKNQREGYGFCLPFDCSVKPCPTGQVCIRPTDAQCDSLDGACPNPSCHPQQCGPERAPCPEGFSCVDECSDTHTSLSSTSDCPKICRKDSTSCGSCGPCELCGTEGTCAYQTENFQYKASDGCNICTCPADSTGFPEGVTCTERVCADTCQECGPCEECNDQGNCVYQVGKKIKAHDGCNTCQCGGTADAREITCTEQECPGSCTSNRDCGDACQVCMDGTCRPKPDGYEFLKDGCVECVCRNGQEYCQAAECVEQCADTRDCPKCHDCVKGTCEFTPDVSFLHRDGCNTCTCVADLPSGPGVVCTLMACPPTCDRECGPCEVCGDDGSCIWNSGATIFDGCNTCTCGRTREEGKACTKKLCPEQECEPGETLPPPDRCNTCICDRDGRRVCTKMLCEEPCPLVQCRLYCEFGFKHDDNGCPLCACRERDNQCPDVVCPEVLCAPGFQNVQVRGECCPSCEEVDSNEPECSREVLVKKTEERHGPLPKGTTQVILKAATSCDEAAEVMMKMTHALAKDLVNRTVVIEPKARCCRDGTLGVLYWVSCDDSVKDSDCNKEQTKTKEQLEAANNSAGSALRSELNTIPQSMEVEGSQVPQNSSGMTEQQKTILIACIAALLALAGSIMIYLSKCKSKEPRRGAQRAEGETEMTG